MNAVGTHRTLVRPVGAHGRAPYMECDLNGEELMHGSSSSSILYAPAPPARAANAGAATTTLQFFPLDRARVRHANTTTKIKPSRFSQEEL